MTVVEDVAPNRLAAHLASRADYVVFVGTPVEAPRRWTRATSYTGAEIVTAEGRHRVDGIEAFVVAYPNLQLLDAEPRGLTLPAEVVPLEPAPLSQDVRITIEEASAGLALVDVRHDTARMRDGRIEYRTTLTNLTDEPIRITEFGGFAETDGAWTLNTVTGALFSAGEFIAWYRVPADGWLAPGTSASDPDNYGGPPALWAYYGETKAGRRFVTGRVAPREP
jgi:hypothetical protein